MFQFDCPSCGVRFKVKPEFAGKVGRCKECGNSVRIPTAGDPEYIDVEPTEEPYALKGDQLGMSLAEFKTKHHRTMPGSQTEGSADRGLKKLFGKILKYDRTAEAADRELRKVMGEKYDRIIEEGKSAPWCSDSRPGEAVEPLLSYPYFADAGLVNCRLDFPSETISGDRQPPTVADVPTERLLYHFVDNQLFKISAWFDIDYTEVVYEALAAKYGPPLAEEKTGWVWDNIVSGIYLVKGKRKNQWTGDPTTLILKHHELCEKAESREPGPAVDDL